MNEIIKNLLKRKSIRSYTDQEIPADCKEQILRAAMEAPTAGNQQMYTILDITSQELKNRLSVTCDHQPFIAKGKMVLIFCADFQKWYQAFALAGCTPRKPGPGDFLLAVEDAAIAAQNAVTAAESLGIGSCYIGDIMENYEIHRDLLHLPEFVFPALMLVFGYPTPQQQEREKPRRAPLDFIVHENVYPQFSPEDIRRNIADLKGEDFDQWMQKFCKRKYQADFSLEMSRSVAAALKNFQA
ncbi:MAG TPA: nitroreductase family protein [Candidatus Blautia merdigallinarum]|uniref:Nitroreductase family protein n=1 Tax=Candidatus Blautia merdigallinarum TaxID=2838495 RepID=A0A9D2N5G7_9FIRM|nr:nitroreductase family protein [Candidatus Blautia merdigallinarum]